MVQSKMLCTDQHICRSCRKPVFCETYKYACAWRNGDEDDCCDDCLVEVANSMEAWEREQETIKAKEEMATAGTNPEAHQDHPKQEEGSSE